jgi:hypothetical protein
MITLRGYYRLKDMSASGLAKGRTASCSRNEQKSVGKVMRKKRKPRSANLGWVGLGKPFHSQIPLKEYLSWIRRKAMLFLSKTANHLFFKPK